MRIDVARHLADRNQAAVHRLAVDEHRAGAALAFAAAFLRAGEPKILAEHVDEPPERRPGERRGGVR